jgi:hypothetical protein
MTFTARPARVLLFRSSCISFLSGLSLCPSLPLPPRHTHTRTHTRTRTRTHTPRHLKGEPLLNLGGLRDGDDGPHLFKLSFNKTYRPQPTLLLLFEADFDFKRRFSLLFVR